MNSIKAWVTLMWRPILAFLAVALVVGCILGFRLGSLTGGASQSELNYISSVSSGRQLLQDPTFSVHKLPSYVLALLHIKSLAAYRTISAVFASMAVVSLFFVLREWYSDRIAILGSWLFLSSAWLLHVGRLATPEVSYLLLLPMLWTAVWLYNTTLRKTAFFLLSLLAGVSFYIPGFGWLLVMVLIWRHKLIWEELRQVPWWFRLFCMLLILLVLAPMGWAAFQSPKLLLDVAGLPDKIPSPRQLIDNLVSVPASFLWLGRPDPVRWLGRLPILDVFSTVMLAFGIYSLRFHLLLVRAQLVVATSILLAILVVLGGPVTITSLLPVVYITLAGGIAFMLKQWVTVFPRNPVARTLATSLMSLAVLLVSYYQINQYFIAWPQTPATKAAFSGKIVTK